MDSYLRARVAELREEVASLSSRIDRHSHDVSDVNAKLGRFADHLSKMASQRQLTISEDHVLASLRGLTGPMEASLSRIEVLIASKVKAAVKVKKKVPQYPRVKRAVSSGKGRVKKVKKVKKRS